MANRNWYSQPQDALDETTRQRRDRIAKNAQRSREASAAVFGDTSGASTVKAVEALTAAGARVTPLLRLRAGFAQDD